MTPEDPGEPDAARKKSRRRSVTKTKSGRVVKQRRKSLVRKAEEGGNEGGREAGQGDTAAAAEDYSVVEL